MIGWTNSDQNLTNDQVDARTGRRPKDKWKVYTLETEIWEIPEQVLEIYSSILSLLKAVLASEFELFLRGKNRCVF